MLRVLFLAQTQLEVVARSATTERLATLCWWEVLCLILIPGAFGGALSVLQMIDINRLMDHERLSVLVSRRRFLIALLLGALGGCGGAFAVLLVGLWTHQLDDFADAARNRLVFCSLGVVAGFIGFRILKSVANNLEKQIHDSELRTEDRIKEVERRLIQDDNLLEKARVTYRSQTVPPAEIREIIQELETVRARRGGDRVIGIVLGNLYDKLGEHAKAVSVVTSVLGVKGRLGSSEDKDAADLLFNRACYRVPLFQKEQDLSKKEILKKQILEDLKVSFCYSPANRIIAKGDEDLRVLEGDKDFNALVDG